MPVTYEWAVEVTTAAETDDHEKGEVLDVSFFDTFTEARRLADMEPDPGTENVMLLVRITEEGKRTWAYLVGGNHGMLPIHFGDAWGLPQTKVPARFRRELERARR